MSSLNWLAQWRKRLRSRKGMAASSACCCMAEKIDPTSVVRAQRVERAGSSRQRVACGSGQPLTSSNSVNRAERAPSLWHRRRPRVCAGLHPDRPFQTSTRPRFGASKVGIQLQQA
ncbi:hypothetical protein P692DRAFT_20248267 [Suillus brevipes Sb2]|nr:hypothetical protein P692DRAFT_20248267 [Suillus brevipes Sb2]